MGSDQYPRVALSGRGEWYRGKGGPKRRWIHMIKEDCTERRLNIIEVQRAATN